MDKIVIAGLIDTGNGCREGHLVVDRESGLITDVLGGRDALCKYREEGDGKMSGEAVDLISRDGLSFAESYLYDDSYIIEVGDFNAHSHPEQSLYTDIVDKSWDLPTWCRNTIYKYSPVLRPEHVYLACCRAFSRMLRLGVTSVMVSFYCHMRQGNTFDLEVIRAARDTGIRLYFGRMNYDIINHDAYEAKRNSQHCYFETPEEAERNLRELVREVESGQVVACPAGAEALSDFSHIPRTDIADLRRISGQNAANTRSTSTRVSGNNVLVAPAIHSIHASTREAIVRAINLGNELSRAVQFHLSEDQGDVALSLEWYGLRPIEFLVDLLEKGEVTSLGNLVLSDCVWIDERERELIREHGMKVVLNPRMNARIKTGEADLPALLGKGVDVYLGTDGEASNDDLSIKGEREFLQQRFPAVADQIPGLGRQPFRFNAGFVGGIAPGHYCDLRVLRHGVLQDVFVGGKKVVADGVLTGIDVEKEIEQPFKNLLREMTTAGK